jgi:hypothetical protein
MPFALAAAIFTALLLAAVPAALLVLGVRDWRCHGAALLSNATVGATRLGTLTPLLLLGLAVAWRYRDRARILVPVLATVVSVKLFLWPLVFWLVATGRKRSAAATVALGTVATLVAWAVLGFAGLREYPDLLARLADAVQAKSYSAVSLGLALGLPESAASVAASVLGVALIGLAFVAVRRSPAGDEWALILALLAALAFTPILWLHYFLLLFLPIAVFRKTLSPAWLIPLAFWITPFQETGGDVWRILLAASIVGATVAAIAWRAHDAAGNPLSTP